MENTDIKILNEYYMKIKFHLDTRPLININNLSYKELIDLLFRIFSKISIHKKKPVVNIIDEVVFALCINQQGSGSYMPCRDIMIIDNMKLCSVSNNSFAAKYIENNKKALEKYGFIF